MKELKPYICRTLLPILGTSTLINLILAYQFDEVMGNKSDSTEKPTGDIEPLEVEEYVDAEQEFDPKFRAVKIDESDEADGWVDLEPDLGKELKYIKISETSIPPHNRKRYDFPYLYYLLLGWLVQNRDHLIMKNEISPASQIVKMPAWIFEKKSSQKTIALFRATIFPSLIPFKTLDTNYTLKKALSLFQEEIEEKKLSAIDY